MKALNLTGQSVDLNVAGIHGTSDISSKRLQDWRSRRKGQRRYNAYSHPNVNAGNRTYNLKKLEETYPHRSVLKDSTINLKDVKVILDQECYHLHRATDYRKRGNAKPWAVRTKLGWMLSGPLPQQETAKLTTESFGFADVDPLVDQMKTRWGMELYTSHCSVFEISKEITENSPDIVVVERNWLEVNTNSILLEIKQNWQEEMQLVAGDHNMLKQEKNKEFSNTEEKNEHERVAITSNLHDSEEYSGTLDLLKQTEYRCRLCTTSCKREVFNSMESNECYSQHSKT